MTSQVQTLSEDVSSRGSCTRTLRLSRPCIPAGTCCVCRFTKTLHMDCQINRSIMCLNSHKWKSCLTPLFHAQQLQLQNSVFNRTVLRGVMQCYRLVGKGEFSASIGTAGDCCVRWKCVPDDCRSHNGETSLADGRVCPWNEQVAAASRTERPTWQIRDWADDLLELDRTGTSDTVLKVRCHIRNPIPSIDVYLLENNPTKFHPDLTWNDGALGFFRRVSPKQEQQKMSSDMGSVPDSTDSKTTVLWQCWFEKK